MKNKWRVYKGEWIITNNKPRQADCIAKLDAIGKRHANLIANAPELLEALKACVFSLRTFRNVPIDEQMWVSSDDDAIEAGFAAIEAANAPRS